MIPSARRWLLVEVGREQYWFSLVGISFTRVVLIGFSHLVKVLDVVLRNWTKSLDTCLNLRRLLRLDSSVRPEHHDLARGRVIWQSRYSIHLAQGQALLKRHAGWPMRLLLEDALCFVLSHMRRTWLRFIHQAGQRQHRELTLVVGQITVGWLNLRCITRIRVFIDDCSAIRLGIHSTSTFFQFNNKPFCNV